MSSCYDVIIVGAGIAGLHCGIELLKRTPSLRCCILEAYAYTGGRVVTHHTTVAGRGPLHWENGAGRISRAHRRVLGLLRTYGLTVRPLGAQWDTQTESSDNPRPSTFTSLADVYLPPLRALGSVLGHTTLAALLPRVYGADLSEKWMKTFPYYAEFHTLRADIALDVLSPAGDLHSPVGFVGCVEGLSELIKRMADEFAERGGLLLHRMRVHAIEKDVTPLVLSVHESCKGQKGQKGQGQKAQKAQKAQIPRVFYANRVVFATDVTSLRSIAGIRSLPVLRLLQSEPLLRIYAVFPVREGKSWFSGLNTTVTDSPIRFFIPIDASKGVAMISYTEGPDAERWMVRQDPVAVLAALRRLFSHLRIPDPLRVTFHPWKTGCTYWLPGAYSPVEESDKSVQPFPHRPLYLCGESFAVHQSWMESALEQAEKVLRVI